METMNRIYLDANATTPLLPEVVEAMLPFFTTASGNPSSAHQAGQRTRSAVEHSRASVARLLNCTSKEIVFTSGGTESNNLALFGILQSSLDHPANTPAHLITTQIEHHAVLYPAQYLEARGLAVTYLPPTTSGIIDPEAFEAALRTETRLVSIMFANNETGAIQPVAKLARIAKAFAERHGTTILIHTDAVQAAAKLPLDLSGPLKNIDLLSLSGHKMYAPQGTGVLFVRKGVQLTPLFHGGPHERQRRAGTENVPGIVALGRASELAETWLSLTNRVPQVPPPTPANRVSQAPATNRVPQVPPLGPGFAAPHSSSGTQNPSELAALRDRLEQGLLAAIPNTHINGPSGDQATLRAPNTTNLRFTGVDAEALLIALDIQGIATSFGAACQSGATEPSHVLTAMGLTAGEARSSLRFSLSRLTTAAEITRALALIPAAVARLRSLS